MLISVLATLAVSAVGSAPAEAVCGGTPPTKWVYCNDANAEIGTPAAKIVGTSGVSELVGSHLGVEVKVVCQKDTITGVFELLGKSKGEIIFRECKLVKPANCKLSAADEEKISMTFNGTLIGEVSPGAKVEEELTGQGAGNQFGFIEIVPENAECILEEGEYAVAGKQKCQLVEPESLKAEHEIACKKTGSELTWGGVAASFKSIEKVKLESGLAWASLIGT
jgi:hypothetical protein